ncbi:MAG: transposase, partial [Chloroflexota bacterium]
MYRLYPTRTQAATLNNMLEECRWLYNNTLAYRKEIYEQESRTANWYETKARIPLLKRERPSLRSVHSQVLQDVTARVDLAFQHYFRRVKSGEKEAGYPRFRGHGRFDSLCYTQAPSGCNLVGDILHLSKVGPVQVVLHRPLEGTPKTVCIKHSSTGKWYATFSCEWEPIALPVSNEHVGIDVGLKTFATLSTGEEIQNPRFFRSEEKALAKANRLLAKETKGSPERHKRRRVVARVHERIGWRRQDFAHQHSRRIVNRYGFIAVEDLEVNRMLHNHCLAKSISDAAWSGFRELLTMKAEWAARTLVAVHPAYTSQTCSDCGHRLSSEQKLKLGDRIFECACCRIQIDRDVNASRNILALGIQRMSSQSLE